MGFDLTSLLNLYRAYLSFYGAKNVRSDITLLSEGGGIVIFPVPPDNLPRITSPQNNDTYNSVMGDVSIMGLLGLRTVEFEDFLVPSNTGNYSWARGDSGGDVINFINDKRQTGKPLRIIITKGDVTYLNMAVLIDDFDYYMDNQADYHINVKFKEYRTYNPTTGGLET